MNFLAHLYLSGSNVDIRLGNFIGDYVKGRNLEHYPERVQLGIKLHRSIDHFTDSHPSIKKCTHLLKPQYGRYSGVIVDVLLDHVLANEWQKYSKSDLKRFTRSFYFQMLRKYNLLPDRVKKFLPFMIQSNRLYSYKSFDGLKRALEIMSSVTSLPDKSAYAINELKTNYQFFNDQFNIFFPELIAFVENEFGIHQVD